LADRTISKPTGVAKNIFVKVGKFYFPVDFVVLDFIADPRVSLILGRPFLSTAHAIINVHKREIILRQDQHSLTIQCGDIPSIKKVEQVNKIDFINAGGIDFESEEIENFLNDDSIPFGVEDSPFNMDEDILFLESLLIEEPSPPHLIISNQTKLPIKEPKHSFKMGYEHFNTNSITKDVAESSTKNLIPIPHESKVVSEDGRRDDIITDDVLPPRVENEDSDEEVDDVDVLRVDNFIQNSKHEYSESEDFDFDNPPLPLPPPKPPDKEFDFGNKISVVRSAIVKFEYIDARIKLDVFSDENEDLSYFMFVMSAKVFSLLFAESEDTIFDPELGLRVNDNEEKPCYNYIVLMTRSTETFDGLATIQVQLNNLGREIKKVNEKVYAAQVGCELCKGPHYTKDYPQIKEGKTLEEAYYTQFDVSFPQGGQYRAGLQDSTKGAVETLRIKKRRQSMEESMSKFMAEFSKRHEENSNLIKEIRASTDAAIRNRDSSIKALEIQIVQMSKVL
nr:hypothetical protein [Tanacetum cinerariifolium]